MINHPSSFQHQSKSTKSYTLRLMYEMPVVQVSTALILTIFAILFFAIFAIRPTLVTISELIKKIDDQEVVVDKLNKKAAALATAQSEYLLVESKIPLVDAAIPPEHQAGMMVKQIEAAAAQLQIPITSIQVDSISVPSDASHARVVDGVVEMPLTISVESSYTSLRAMIDLVESLKRFVTVESVSMILEDNEGEEDVPIKLNVSVLAYYLLEPQGNQ